MYFIKCIEVMNPTKIILIEVMNPTKIILIEVMNPTKIILIEWTGFYQPTLLLEMKNVDTVESFK
ncbi:MAG: hypothetical protein PHI90_10395 [Clostridia bacterium]|nr:hypothetical protein [Clostridia bacterium]